MRILIWGTGKIAQLFFESGILEIEKSGIEIIGFVDNNNLKWGTEFSGKKIYSPNDIRTMVFDKLVICLRGDFYTQVYRQIVYDLGISDEKIENVLWLESLKGRMKVRDFKQSRQPQIYDCFIFYNEFELLELRLKLLAPYVDYFVIAEMQTDFNGDKKPCYFFENRERFDAYKDKILYVCSEDAPNDTLDKNSKGYALDYPRIMYLRNTLQTRLQQCQPMDYILLSDIDEIPNPRQLRELCEGNGKLKKNFLEVILQKYPITFEQDYFYYFMNLRHKTKWYGTCMIQYQNLTTFEELRNEKDYGSLISIANGGWHFSCMGGLEGVKQKIRVSNETKEVVGEEITDELIKEYIENRKDVFFRTSSDTEESRLDYLENYEDLEIDGIEEFIMKYPYMWKEYND